MSRELFNTVIKYEGREYRFNEKEALLEWVSFEDLDEDGEWITLDEPVVIDCIGVQVEYAEMDLMSYISTWHEQISEESAYLSDQF